ncbi:MAG: translation elongation factor Ts [Bacilli bacterium]|nr:translation elongation factor Ts [Bacilli bacterium]
MADSLIDLIKVLRDRTGAGLMDCKGALLANECNLDKACDYLREKGLAKAAKKADRIAAEGLVVIKSCPHCGKTVIVEVNCETDFVSKGDAFKELVEKCAEVILSEEPADIAAAKDLTKDLFTDATVKMGEKFDLRRFTLVKKNDNAIYTYIHMGGKIGVVAVLDKADDETGKGLAMHIAANNPTYGSKADIGAEAIAHETEVQTKAAAEDPKFAGKPAAMIEKIIAGKVDKYFSEMVLTEQAYLLDDSKKVGVVLKEKNVNVVKYIRYQVGEGIEKRQDDFAAEVMSQAK